MRWHTVFSVFCLGLVLSNVGQSQEAPDRAERLGRLPGELIKNKKTDAEIVEALFLATLTRIPTDKDKENVLKHLKAATNRQAACEDVLWALMNTKEFAVLNCMTVEQMQQFSDKVITALKKK